jgi:putative phage-type endonuclease
VARVVQMADRTDWLAWRRKRIGASEAGTVAGFSPFQTRLELWLEKCGLLPETAATNNMLLGLALEPVIAAAVERKLGVTIDQRQLCLESEDHDYMSATLDGVDTLGNVHEFKAPGQWSAKTLGDDGDSDSLPIHWTLQAQHQAIVSRTDGVTVHSIQPSQELLLYLLDANENGPHHAAELWLDRLDVRSYPVERNPSMCDSLIYMEREFSQNVELGIPPEEVTADDAATLARAFLGSLGEIRLSHAEAEAATRYLDLADPIKVLEEERSVARARLLLAMGDHTIGLLPDGRTVRRSIVNVKAQPPKPKAAFSYPRLSIKGVSS